MWGSDKIIREVFSLVPVNTLISVTLPLLLSLLLLLLFLFSSVLLAVTELCLLSQHFLPLSLFPHLWKQVGK